MGFLMRREMKRDARTVSGWDFDRIIPCHGVSFLVRCARGGGC